MLQIPQFGGSVSESKLETSVGYQHSNFSFLLVVGSSNQGLARLILNEPTSLMVEEHLAVMFGLSDQ